MWSPIVVTSHPTLCAGAQAVTDMLAISLLGLMLRFVETLMFVPAVGEVLMILRYMIVDSWPVMVILFYFTFVCAVHGCQAQQHCTAAFDAWRCNAAAI